LLKASAASRVLLRPFFEIGLPLNPIGALLADGAGERHDEDEHPGGDDDDCDPHAGLIRVARSGRGFGPTHPRSLIRASILTRSASPPLD
jgi:hypothetical protein